MSSNRRIEIEFTDPDTYSSIINHDIRKRILRTLYDSTKDAPISKQDLADKLGVGYYRLGYQLNNHLKDFWTVREERKVRGARMESDRAGKTFHSVHHLWEGQWDIHDGPGREPFRSAFAKRHQMRYLFTERCGEVHVVGKFQPAPGLRSRTRRRKGC